MSDSATAPAATGTGLPPPPSGDYELELDAGQISALVERRYGELFRTARLSPTHLDRLRSLLAERQQASVDAANSALLTGLNPIRDLPTIRSAIEQAQAEVDATIRAELGEPVFSAVSEHDRTLPERNSVVEFARLLAAAREPLRPEQEQRLLQILKNHSGQASPADLDRAIFGGLGSRTQISKETIAAAAPLLSPRQLELLRELQQRGPAETAQR